MKPFDFNSIGHNGDGEEHAAQPPAMWFDLVLPAGGARCSYGAGYVQELMQWDMMRSGQVAIRDITGASGGSVVGMITTHGLNRLDLPLEDRCELVRKNIGAFWNKTSDSHAYLMLAKKMDNPFAFTTPSSTAFYDFLDRHSKHMKHDIDHIGSRLGLLSTAEYINMCVNFWNPAEKRHEHWPNLSEEAQAAFDKISPDYALPTLKSILQELMPDWDTVSGGPVQLTVNAVRMKDPEASFNQGNLISDSFTGSELTIDHAVASAALRGLGPHKLGDTEYYDGAYVKCCELEHIDKYRRQDRHVIMLATQEPPEGRIKPLKQRDYLKTLPKDEDTGIAKHDFYHHGAYLAKRYPGRVHISVPPHEPHFNDSIRYNTDRRWINLQKEQGREAAREFIAQMEAHPLLRPSTQSEAEPDAQPI